MIGRETEKKILAAALTSQRAELGVIYGRRRVGKSCLLKSVMRPNGDFYFEGVKGLSETAQIEHFLDQLSAQTGSLPFRATAWKDAFAGFSKFIESGTCYVVFDELPWMASQKTELISWLKYFWDNHWKKNSKLTLVLCGSIANFMVKHVVHSEALHNRKTFEFKLEPLSASESKNFFSKGKSRYDIAKYLMIFGGIPKYLEQLDSHVSLSQNVDRLCFQKGGFFLEEFETIFKEQFKVIKKYGALVKSLATLPQSKERLSQSLGLSSGGSLSQALENLERAGFIHKQTALSWATETPKEKTVKYCLWDEWLRFYFSFMAPQMKLIRLNARRGLFEKITTNRLSPYWGKCFERLVEKNLPNVLDALDLDLGDIVDFGPYFQQSPRLNLNAPTGAQVDLVLKRRDKTICLIESKFTDTPVGLKTVHEMKEKVRRLGIPNQWNVETVLISASGVTSEVESSEYFHRILDLDCIFE